MPFQYDQTHDEWRYSYDNVGTSITDNVANKSITITPNGTDYDVVDENGLPIELKTWEKYDQGFSIDYTFNYDLPFITQGGVDVQQFITGENPTHYVVLVAPSKTPEQGYEIGESPEQPIQIPDFAPSYQVVIVLDGVTEISSPFFSGELMDYCKTIYLPDSPITLNQGYDTFLPLNSTTGIRLGDKTAVFPMLSQLYGISTWRDEQGNTIDTTKMYAKQGMYEHRANETTVDKYVDADDEYHILMMGANNVVVLNKTQGNVMFWLGFYDNSFIYFSGNPITLSIDQNGEIQVTYSGETVKVKMEYAVSSDVNSAYVYGDNVHVNPDNPAYALWTLNISSNGIIMNWAAYNGRAIYPPSDWCGIQIDYKDRIADITYDKDHVITITLPQKHNDGVKTVESPLVEKSIITLRHVEWDGEKSDDVMWGLFLAIMIFTALSSIIFIMPRFRLSGIRRYGFEEEW